MKNKEIHDKAAKTCIEKYGAKNPFQSEEIKDKIKFSMINKYGVDNPMKNKEIQDKAMKTCVTKYGVEHALQNQGIIQNMYKNNLEKYGVKYISQIPDVRKKVTESMFKQNSMCTSIQQKYIAKLYNMELNYPILYWSVDMYDKVNDYIIEYDGGGHWLSVKLGDITQEEFNNNELIREKSIRQDGHKIIRIISQHDKLPTDKVLLQMLSDANQYFQDYPNHSWINFDIDSGVIRNAEYQDGKSYDYGDLRKIKKSDLKSA